MKTNGLSKLALSAAISSILLTGCGSNDSSSPVSSSASATGLKSATTALDTTSAPTGKIEYAQTHVVQQTGGTLLAPVPTIGRQTLILFTPDYPLTSGESFNLIVQDAEGKVLGTEPLEVPANLPSILESGLTTKPLAPYSTQAWSIAIPGELVRPPLKFLIESTARSGITLDATPKSWSRPADFDIGRTAYLLWGAQIPSNYVGADVGEMTQDFFASVPLSHLNYFDYPTVSLDYAITKIGSLPPKKYTGSAAVYTDGGDAGTIYGFIKRLAGRASMANTGRGLILNTAEDTSPYSIGTWMSRGWFPDSKSGQTKDITSNFGMAGGRFGWSTTWSGKDSECGNEYIHELGHSFSLDHFDTGASTRWKISSEYPYDGVNGPQNPWGYDSTRNLFRTWYRVDSTGPVTSLSSPYPGQLVGKRDPMNGGEAGNIITCYPQFTAYQAQKMQNWLDSTPTLITQAGKPIFAKWNKANASYTPTTPAAGGLNPTALGVPVVTIIGSLTSDTSNGTTQIYPANAANYGNLFDLPDPTNPNLASVYSGAVYYAKVTFANGTTKLVLIPSAAITNSATLNYFSFNVDAKLSPTKVELYKSAAGYPQVSTINSTLLYSRDIPAFNLDALPTVHQQGVDPSFDLSQLGL
ncbi:M66 family metalloprotease [Aquirhabdus sp.]|uniref:M66 family metalloprotease n=1 Tax=Aquirhabdus sp. TaxID=2824160 RepID=UPI00396CBE1A